MSSSLPVDSSQSVSRPNSPEDLQAVVKVNEPDGQSWKEVTNVASISRNGASFSLSRACKVGRLVMLVLPLAPELRAYDKQAANYPVIGLVQYCNEGQVDDQKVYHTGVAFIGKNLPDSYKASAGQSYHICGMNEIGLWQIAESKNQFKPRKHPRFSISLGVSLTLLGQERGKSVREDSYTLNVSATGASVVSSIEANPGDRIKIGCKEVDFYAIAHVRNRDAKDGKPSTLHLEFVDVEFPMDKIYCGQADVRPSNSSDFVPPPATEYPSQRL